MAMSNSMNGASRQASRERVASLGLSFLAPVVLALPLVLAGCAGSGSGDQVAGGAFVVLSTYPENNGRIFLNESVRIEFSNPVDLATANFNSVAFLVRDGNGNPLSESVVGTFRHGTNDSGMTDRRILEFVPRLATNDTYSDGGFRGGRQYLLSLINASNGAAPTLRDADGRQLSESTPVRGMSFTTASGSTPQELFLDRQAGGPRIVSVDVTPKLSDRVALNDLGGIPVEFSVRFNQALNPASTNVPLRQPIDPTRDAVRQPGKIFLEYDDPQLGTKRWVRAAVEMPTNSLTDAVVTLRPDGILPNDAEIRLIVENSLQDIAGESNSREPNYQRVVSTFKTEARHAVQFDAVVFDFESSDYSDPDAAFRDPPADIVDGELRASFTFDGIETPLNYEPNAATNVLSTDFTTLVPSNGLPFDVVGGVFRINDIFIRRGVTVRGVGSNPMVWLASGDVRIDGHLHVNGGDGSQVDTLNGANFPTAAGAGVCTGGNGGQGSPNTSNTSPKGQDGAGPFQRPGEGGRGGGTACGTTSGYGAGGGGGSHAQVGDVEFTTVFDADPLANGVGGPGSGGTGAIGGQPMPSIFVDSSKDNDFWGRGFTTEGEVIVGELKSPRGGGGGGGGGDRSPSAQCSAGPVNFVNDEKGGGGGGGAGVLVIRALGTITVGPDGLISADGGRGGGGEDAGGSRQGGGGAGGAGGMVVLEASRVIIYQHGNPWSSKDAKFAVTADGSIGTNSSWQAAARLQKYQNENGRPNNGGFGGMGIVQILTPAGRDDDQTGNVQDDNILFLDANDRELTNKLGWLNAGDIRPKPVLMPATYGRTSSWFSRYISTGASVRRVVEPQEAGVRSTTSKPSFDPTDSNYGPDYYFAGLIQSGSAAGYLKTSTDTGFFTFPLLRFGSEERFAIAGLEASATQYRGLDCHRVTVAAATFPADGSLANMEARFFNASASSIGDYRILWHDATTLLLDARDGLLPNGAVQVGVAKKFFDVVTEGNAGLGRTYEVKVNEVSRRYPVANVQIGFAFHKDPSKPAIVGNDDNNRFPTNLGQYVYDLETTGVSSVREQLRKLHYPFVQLKVRFNLDYNFQTPDTKEGLNPVNALSQRPGLRFVRLPYAY